MKFAQFFPVSGFAHEAFLLTDSLEGHGYYSEEAESADFAAGDYAARDTRANDGLLKLWSFGGAPEEIHLIAGAWSESGTVAASEWDAFTAWLVGEAGASTTEAEQIIEALRRESPTTMKVAIYNENCTLAGREVPESKIESWDEADGEPCDWTTYEGTPEELLAIAAVSDKADGAPGRANLYGMRVAEVLRREVYRFHPELEPVVCTKDDPEWDDDCGCPACVEERLYRKD